MVMAFVCKIKKRFGKTDKFFKSRVLVLILDFLLKPRSGNFNQVSVSEVTVSTTSLEN